MASGKGVELDKITVSANVARKMLGTSPNRIQELLDGGEILAYKEGNRWHVLVESIKDYARRRAKTETQERTGTLWE